MTPDYPALAQRLREIVPFTCTANRAKANADLCLAASALDRLAGMETALSDLETAARALLPVNCDGLHHAKADRHEGATSCPVVARALTALSAARRALEGMK